MIILFDIDGVLVNNLAYRAGIQQTQQYFAERLSLRARTPTQADIDVFEAEPDEGFLEGVHLHDVPTHIDCPKERDVSNHQSVTL